MRSGRIWRCCFLPALRRTRPWHPWVRLRDTTASRPGLGQIRCYNAISSESRAEESLERSTSWEERLFGPTPPSDDALNQSSIEELSNALMAMRPPQEWSLPGQDFDRHSRIVQIVNHMVGTRDQTPTIFIYECMMDAMADPQGSADGVHELFDDMETQGIKPSQILCQSALAALAIHPDYKLRQDVLALMRDLWFPVDTAAQQNVVIGLLRDEQYELAYARLTRLIDQDARIDSWVLDLFIMAFGKLGFLDEMLVLLQHRKAFQGASEEVMTTLLYYVLDVCSEAFHLAGTVYAWEAIVRSSRVQPPDGIVENVLATAARHGKPLLAAEVLDLLSQRAWGLLPHHYEAVVEAFAGGGDIVGALRILCIMRKQGKQGIIIKRDHTRSIKQAMMRNPDLLPKAEKAARALASDESEPLSPALVGVIIETQAELLGSEAAMSLYKDITKLCASPADALTMQTLMTHSKTHDTCRTVARHYAAAVPSGKDPPRNPRVYGRLIPACAAAGEMDLAFRFAAQALPSCRSRPQLTWVKPLMDCAVAREDGRIWNLVDELMGRDDGDVRAAVRLAMEQTRLAKQVSDRRRA
ncbi:hypothetical protein XA68_17965 [Ophiocordyceps unilateralis]|uniref:Pentatricopeptide repeat-containing protein-mitochondrial domain-containing protein n=1 Tax=Ophiocordyceps unilateralis TaxID=268505 RepID=A0A2A9PK03_OPHUN|nr:hypothetical protein XA68_17965 [Ophiocordyceps unilateralis]